MSWIDKTYFKFNAESVNLDVNLGDSKEYLLSEGLIKTETNDDQVYYTGIKGTPWRIDFTNEKVSKLWFNRDSIFILNGKDVSGEKYSDILPLLDSNFESLNSTIHSVEEMKNYTDSAVIYVVCRDFFITLIGIINNKA